jgi:hypothetical protein
VKDHLVCNATLAQLADRYGLPDNLIADQSALYSTQGQVKTKGSLFESWVAGVYYSYILNGGEGEAFPKPAVQAQISATIVDKEVVSSPSTSEGTVACADSQDQSTVVNQEDQAQDLSVASLSEILSSTLGLRQETVEVVGTVATDQAAKQPSSSKTEKRTHGEAFQHLYQWLCPLFSPVAQFALQAMQAEQKRLFLGQGDTSGNGELLTWQDADRKAPGSKAALNVYAENKWSTTPRYIDIRHGEALWKVRCEVDDEDGKTW